MEARDDEKYWEKLLESGREKAPDGFADAIMDKLFEEEIPLTRPRPLLSRRAWTLIGFWAAGLFAAGYMTSYGSGTPFSNLRSFMPDWRLDLEHLITLPELTDTFVWCSFALLIFATLHLFWMSRRSGGKPVF